MESTTLMLSPIIVTSSTLLVTLAHSLVCPDASRPSPLLRVLTKLCHLFTIEQTDTPYIVRNHFAFD
jgi:hypothetical protein